MGEAHDNTIPDKRGTHSISKTGIVSYLPLQENTFFRPFIALVLYQRADGEIFCSIDERWKPLKGIED